MAAIKKFYFTPGACSMGIHILLEELELVYEAYPVDLLKGEQLTDEFLAINPKASVPVLVLPDGTALTDFLSIAWWLAKSHPRAALLPQSLQGEAAVIELLNYAVNTIHGQGFTRIFTVEKYTVHSDDMEQVKNQGRVIVEDGFAVVERQLSTGKWGSGDFSIADAALFYVEFWADKTAIPLPASCLKHYHQLLQRASVRQVLMEEGYHTTLLNSPLEAGKVNHAIA